METGYFWFSLANQRRCRNNCRAKSCQCLYWKWLSSIFPSPSEQCEYPCRDYPFCWSFILRWRIFNCRCFWFLQRIVWLLQPHVRRRWWWRIHNHNQSHPWRATVQVYSQWTRNGRKFWIRRSMYNYHWYLYQSCTASRMQYYFRARML